MKPWSIAAVNLPEHADNPIHTDIGARAGGFPRALVAGVTTYAYLTHPIIAANPEWLASGCGEVRLRSPVFDQDRVICTPDHDTVNALVNNEVRASLRVLAPPTFNTDPGEQLTDLTVTLLGDVADYGVRAGDDLALYREGVMHPVAWPALANRVFHQQLVRGSWVHTRSLIQHHSQAIVGDTVRVQTTVQQRFAKPTGERAIALVRIMTEDDRRPIATIEHEAIIALPGH